MVEGPVHACATVTSQGISRAAACSHLPNAGTASAYGTLSLASSDRALSFPRESTADTE